MTEDFGLMHVCDEMERETINKAEVMEYRSAEGVLKGTANPIHHSITPLLH